MMAKLTTFFVAALGSAAMGATALAYPVLVDAKSVPNIMGADRSHLAAIAPVKGGGFQALAVQVDEVEDGAAIVFRKPTTPLALRKQHAHPSDRDPFGGKLDEVHRVVLEDELFGTCDAACESTVKAEARKACGVSSTTTVGIARIDLDYRKTTAFLLDCRKKQSDPKKTPIKVDMKERTFTTNTYSYTYKDKKNILFDNISLLPERKRLLTDGELLVYLKPKFVFNMQFAEKDLVSRITSITQGPMSTGVEVAFSLDVLSFKVNSQICCDVSLYKDSLYFPIMLDLPFEGSSFKTGSGLFYGLNIDGDIKKDVKFMAENLANYKFSEAKPTSGNGSSALLVHSGDKIVAVGFRSMKSSGSSSKKAPLIAFKEDLKKIEFPEVRSSFGLFYDVTSLSKGFHHFNVWFYVGSKEQEAMLGEYAKNGITYKVSPVY